MTIPKSLHTVTVLINLARHLDPRRVDTPEHAVKHALKVLGYRPHEDAYSLAARAVATLKSEGWTYREVA